jgi:hypothetical protein
MKKLDLKKQFKELYTPPSKNVVTVDVPKFNFLMIDGVGDPNSAQEYQDALAALYAVAYTLKFAIKKNEGIDYPVMALEGLWWAKDVEKLTMEQLMGRRDEWCWTMMIMQPDCVTRAHVKQAMADVAKKKDLASLAQIRFESFREGKCAQVTHIGPYSAEAPNIERLHAFVTESGHKLVGKHHEIYLGDPRRTKPEKLRTVLRQPYK